MSRLPSNALEPTARPLSHQGGGSHAGRGSTLGR
jgi:hypothetical protein